MGNWLWFCSRWVSVVELSSEIENDLITSENDTNGPNTMTYKPRDIFQIAKYIFYL